MGGHFHLHLPQIPFPQHPNYLQKSLWCALHCFGQLMLPEKWGNALVCSLSMPIMYFI